MAAAVAIAVGVWWTANTVSHIVIHRPLFRRRAANACVAALLTALLGFPQSLWRDRHLAHHRGARYRVRLTGEMSLQLTLVASLWLAMILAAPWFFAAVYLPGYAGGLLLCAMHGHYEHAGGTTSHYGRLYNALCFNDGYHVEHHRRPAAPWWTLPNYRERSARSSAWPAPLRWLEPPFGLAVLERLVLRSRLLQWWVVRVHTRAFEELLAHEPAPRDVAIIGGGLFPRTAIVLRRLLPRAHVTIVDANQAHLELARAFVGGDRVAFIHARFNAENLNAEIDLNSEICKLNCQLWVFPLAFDGERAALYAKPPASTVIVHDWIWRTRGTSRVVSPLLLKRLNLVRG